MENDTQELLDYFTRQSEATKADEALTEALTNAKKTIENEAFELVIMCEAFLGIIRVWQKDKNVLDEIILADYKTQYIDSYKKIVEALKLL